MVKLLLKMRAAILLRFQQNRPQQTHEETNKRRVIWIVALFLISVEVPEIPTYIHYCKNSIMNNTPDWFLLSSFHRKQAEYWYYKDTADRIAWIIRWLGVTKMAKMYSTTVFLATFLIWIYLIIDLGMYWVNFNTWPLFYELLILYIYIVGRSLVRPFKPDAYARIRSLF